MKTHPDIDGTLSRPALLPTIGVAIGALLALVVIAGALVIAAAYPTLDGRVIALATGMGIMAVALAVTRVTAALCSFRLPSNNDAWVYW